MIPRAWLRLVCSPRSMLEEKSVGFSVQIFDKPHLNPGVSLHSVSESELGLSESLLCFPNELSCCPNLPSEKEQMDFLQKIFLDVAERDH